MADEKAAGIKGTIAGWIKGAVTSVVALVSGAFLMYLTPVINNTIKPAKPVANFATQANGLTVTFNNLSTGGTAGWWDFGDGAALEPFSPKLSVLTHTYAKALTYNVKLTLQNLVGDESDRTVSLTLDAAAAAAAKPEIELFEVKPMTAERAPALYRLKSKVKNASLCIWSLGDHRPLHLDFDAKPVRYLTIKEPGTFTIRLAAVNGKDVVEKSQTVLVSAGEGLDTIARLSVSYEAVHVDRLERTYHIPFSWQCDVKESVSPIHAERLVQQGYTIAKLEVLNKDEKDAPVRNVRWQVAPDKTRFSMDGELVNAKTWLKPSAPPSWKAEVHVVMERRTAPVTLHPEDVTMPVSLNTTIKLPLQPLEASWEVRRQQVKLELLDGTRKVWETSQPVAEAKVTLKNQPCLVSVSPQSDGLLLKIDAPKAPLAPLSTPPVPAPDLSVAPPAAKTPAIPLVVRPASFERLPLLPRPKSN